MPSLKGVRVLLVDNDEPTRYVWRSYLARAGATVTAADGGGDALQALQKNTFDVLVADLLMPGVNGLELVAQARSFAGSLVAIAVSGASELEAIARRAGFDVYLEKPVELSVLAQEIARHVGS